jgi:hypothetical protein
MIFILAFSLLANAPESVLENDPAQLAEQDMLLEEMLDESDSEEIVFEDLTFTEEEDDSLDL